LHFIFGPTWEDRFNFFSFMFDEQSRWAFHIFLFSIVENGPFFYLKHGGAVDMLKTIEVYIVVTLQREKRFMLCH
ncbi:hypothetical protein PENTCL1PPCAC_8475, partial [Pristionchus entomophagus]